MAYSVNDIYNLVKFLTRKNQSGGISSTDLFYAWNNEQAMYMSDLLGRFQNRSNGKDVSTGLIQNETIMTKLTPFTIPVTISIAADKADKPADFIYTLALRINGTKVFQVPHDSIWSLANDVIDPPSITDDSYYYTEYLNYYKFLPTGLTTVDLDYIATPIPIVWGYDIVSARQVYNAGTSTQPQWDDNSIIEITKRSLTSFGITFKDQDFEQFGKSAIAGGN